MEPAAPGFPGIRAPGTNRCQRLQGAGIVTGLVRCGVDLFSHDRISSSAQSLVGELGSGGQCRLVVGIEGALVHPHGPGNAGEFVGERTSGLVVSGALFQCQSPVLESSQGLTYQAKPSRKMAAIAELDRRSHGRDQRRSSEQPHARYAEQCPNRRIVAGVSSEPALDAGYPCLPRLGISPPISCSARRRA